MHKTQLLSMAQHPSVALTGRIESWLREPEGRLPVSCTVLNVTDVTESWLFTSKALRYAAGVALYLNDVQYPSHMEINQFTIDWSGNLPTIHEYDYVIEVTDSMEGDLEKRPWQCRASIEQSWGWFYQLLRDGMGARIFVDLSALRPAGTANERGLVASGPESFAEIYEAIADYAAEPGFVTLAAVYSTINGVLRRGGTFKNGAITIHLDSDHPEVLPYLEATPEQLPWAKRCLDVGEDFLELPYLDLLCKQISAGQVWLAKKRFDAKGKRLFSNVCLEIAIPSRGTCLLLHHNLGAVENVADIPDQMCNIMKLLCAIHPSTGVGDTEIYLHPYEDRQVGLGVIGLGSLLALEGITYKELVEAWESLLSRGPLTSDKPTQLAFHLIHGLETAANYARRMGMERSLTIAPTASCAYRYEDREGYTTTPEISPPIARDVDRYSGTFGIQAYSHHPRVETAEEVGFDLYFRLADCWQKTIKATGQAHAISFNIWDTQPVDQEFLTRWFNSDLWNIYYRLLVQQKDALDKTVIQSCDLSSECSSCAE
ncbi:MAG: hypothetical protein DDT26_01971 [Dehalococcoidia bacterium]|nr:hypothetical protein [Chloroflexota bacterium]MBT9166200.1 hypothetical protein [Chloroflexota bacterium]